MDDALTMQEKKSLKLNKLYDAAYELFITKGIQETAIDDIVKKAGVAKGTFYLYFHDKYDLIDRMVVQKSSALIEEALKEVEKKSKTEHVDFQNGVIIVIDYLIEYFKKDKELLTVIYKNLSWGLCKEAMNIDKMNNAARLFVEDYKDPAGDTERAVQILYIIIEMVGSVCYSAIVNENPYSIYDIKPALYTSIKKILS